MPSTIDTYAVNPIALTLARAIYHAQAECFGQSASVPFDKMTVRERAPFIEAAARVLIAFSPKPSRVHRTPTRTLSSPQKPPRFEVWSLSRTLARSIFIGEKDSITDALSIIPRKRPLRVRTFYDRRRKRRIVQFLSGNGVAVRDAR